MVHYPLSTSPSTELPLIPSLHLCMSSIDPFVVWTQPSHSPSRWSLLTINLAVLCKLRSRTPLELGSAYSTLRKTTIHISNFMPYFAQRNEEPADAREALLRYCFDKNYKIAIKNCTLSSRPGSPSASSSTSSASSAPPPPSTLSPATSPFHWSESSDDDDDQDPDWVATSEIEEEVDGVQEYIRWNYEKVRQLSICGSPTLPYLRNGYDFPWFGAELDVAKTFFFWDGGLGFVPDEVVNDGIRSFEAGIHLADMDVELRAGIIHAMTSAMLNGRLPHASANLEQIQYFLYETYTIVKDKPGHPSRPPPKREHWLVGTLRDRKKEVEWLKYQAEKRFWFIQNKKIMRDHERSLEPSDTELEAVFDTYIQV